MMIIFKGPRGCGKTLLMNAFKVFLEENGVNLKGTNIETHSLFIDLTEENKRWLGVVNDLKATHVEEALKMKKFDAIDAQIEEFSALKKLNAEFTALPAIVDDDYPEARHRYELAMDGFITALKANGRI